MRIMRIMRKFAIRVVFLCIVVLACACSSMASEVGGTRAAETADAGDVARTVEAGMVDSAAEFPDVTFSMQGHVDAGGEILDCVYVSMPKARGTIAVPSAESHFTPGSHHFLVFRTTYDSVPEWGGSVHPCSDAEQFDNIAGSYYEAQTPDASRSLPKGVAHVFKPGEVLLMTAHYLNPSQVGYDTHVDFRLHTMDPKLVEHEAGSILFSNIQLDVPPMSQVTVTRSCPITQDINLALLWSHMHSRGIAFKATTSDPVAAAQAGDLYDTTTWSEPEPRVFPDAPPVMLHAGSTITYSCTYDNTTAQTFVFGQSAATNEMCILHGMYWPRMDSNAELCLFGSAVVPGADGGSD